jgi:hypothetical protein
MRPLTASGRQTGPTLTVDLRGSHLDSWPDLWEALRAPCGLPDWFGCNLDAWWDTIQSGGVSEILNDHSYLIVIVSSDGLFAPLGDQGERFLSTTNESDYARAEVVDR